MNTSGKAQQQVSERQRRAVADQLLVLAANHCDRANAPGLLIAVPSKRNGVQALFATTPSEFGASGPARQQPCWLAGKMAVEPLFDVAAPETVATLSPTTGLVRPWQIEAKSLVPGVAVSRVFQDAAVRLNGAEGRFKAPVVIAHLKLMGLSRAAVPEPAPSLAWGVCNNWMWAAVSSCVAPLVPRGNIGKPVVDAVGFYEERGNHPITPQESPEGEPCSIPLEHAPGAGRLAGASAALGMPGVRHGGGE